jgi:hypothetical protein
MRCQPCMPARPPHPDPVSHPHLPHHMSTISGGEAGRRRGAASPLTTLSRCAVSHRDSDAAVVCDSADTRLSSARFGGVESPSLNVPACRSRGAGRTLRDVWQPMARRGYTHRRAFVQVCKDAIKSPSRPRSALSFRRSMREVSQQASTMRGMRLPQLSVRVRRVVTMVLATGRSVYRLPVLAAPMVGRYTRKSLCVCVSREAGQQQNIHAVRYSNSGWANL